MNDDEPLVGLWNQCNNAQWAENVLLSIPLSRLTRRNSLDALHNANVYTPMLLLHHSLTSIFVSVHSLIDPSELWIDRSPLALKVIFNNGLNGIVKAEKGTRLTPFSSTFLHVYSALAPLNYEWLSGALLSCALIIHLELELQLEKKRPPPTLFSPPKVTIFHNNDFVVVAKRRPNKTAKRL